jgi:AraC-like DNA-binding protein
MNSLLFHLPKGTASWFPIESVSGSIDFPCVRALFIEEGGGKCQVGQQTCEVTAGSLLLIAPDESCRLSGLINTERWVLNFSLEALCEAHLDIKDFSVLFCEEPIFLALKSDHNRCQPADRCFQIDFKNRLYWSTCLHQLKRELSEKYFGYAEVSHALLKVLAVDMIRLTRQKFESKSSRSLVSKVIRYIEENYNESISLCDVAAALDRSSAYLTDRVRKETGKTVLEWIAEYRMADARRLLLHTDYPVSQIAERVGYFDRRHFSRQFLRFHKMTPQKWRNYHDGGARDSVGEREPARQKAKCLN